MKMCKCGKEIIFEGGFNIASNRVDIYVCPSCNTMYEISEGKQLEIIIEDEEI